MIGRIFATVGLVALLVLPACVGPVSRPEPAVVVGSGRVRNEARPVAGVDAVQFVGAGTLAISQGSAEGLTVDLRGAARVTLGGQADTQRVAIAGAGTYQAGAFTTRETVVEINGAGTALVNASERLRAAINGVGTVEYLGDPTVERTINGLGTVRRRS